MDARDILTDAASRPLAAIRAVAELITPGNLNAHPGGHDNSIAWLLWHMGREIDVQVAHLAGAEELWTARGYAEQLGITEEGIGYGHTPAQARAVTARDPLPLLDYLTAATEALQEYLASLDPSALGEVIDSDWDPPVTRGTRLVSIIDDAAQHAGQVGYALSIAPG